MLVPRYIVGFFGHRENYSDSGVRRAIRKALLNLQEEAKAAGGEIDLLSSVARGTDTICVEIAIELKIPVHIVLPLEEQDFAADFRDYPDDWLRAKRLIDFARIRPGPNSMRVINGEAVRPQCYFNQITHVLDASDMLIAVWDGQPARGQGGTGQAVEQARKLRIPTSIIDPKAGEILNHRGAESHLQPDEVMRRLNAQWADMPGLPGGTISDPQVMQDCLDDIAVKSAGRYRPSLVMMILLHGIAAMLAALVLFSFAHHIRPLITGTELVLVSFALVLAWGLHRSETRRRWLDSRAACELLRGLRATAPLLDALHPAVEHHNTSWRRFALSAGLLVQKNASSFDVFELRDQYLNTRLSDTHPEGQLRHFLTKRPGAERLWRLTRRIGYICAISAPFFVAFSLANKCLAWGFENSFPGWIAVAFFPITLPMAAGIAAGIRQALDVRRRAHRYPQIALRLEKSRAQIRFLETPSTICRAISACEEILLDELVEWHMAAQSTEEH